MQGTRRWWRCAFVAVLLAAAFAAPASASASTPPLEEPPAALANAFECSAGLASATRAPVLLVHGTGSNREENWSWGYRKVLPELGIPTCTVELPDRAFVDLQRSVEYVVYAVRRMHAVSDRRVSVLGQSQGGIHPVWALRFWWNLRPMIDDSIAMGTPYQGSEGGHLLPCASTGCPPAVWQQTTGSNFIAALNRERVPSGPSYTSIATRFDQVAFPQPEASRLPGARQILIQDVCPTRPTDHFFLAADAAAYAIVLDALEHPGPADPARVDPAVCNQVTFPGIDTVKFAQVAAVAFTLPGVTGVAYDKKVTSEPPLRCYADPACAAAVEERCSGQPVNRLGTPGADRLTGTPQADGFRLLGGGDRAVGRKGPDALCGNRGADTLKGGRGKDMLKGGRGNDKLKGGKGRDKLVGGPGRDILVGGKGNDRCIGGPGRDVRRRC